MPTILPAGEAGATTCFYGSWPSCFPGENGENFTGRRDPSYQYVLTFAEETVQWHQAITSTASSCFRTLPTCPAFLSGASERRKAARMCSNILFRRPPLPLSTHRAGLEGAESRHGLEHAAPTNDVLRVLDGDRENREMKKACRNQAHFLPVPTCSMQSPRSRSHMF